MSLEAQAKEIHDLTSATVNQISRLVTDVGRQHRAANLLAAGVTNNAHRAMEMTGGNAFSFLADYDESNKDHLLCLRDAIRIAAIATQSLGQYQPVGPFPLATMTEEVRLAHLAIEAEGLARKARELLEKMGTDPNTAINNQKKVDRDISQS